MADKRRTLGDALSPEVEAFLNQGKQPKAKPSTSKPKPKPKKETPPMSKPALKSEFSADSSPAANNPTHYALPGTGSVNARIEHHITAALQRASTERRIERQTPWMQRDIISEALSDWLKKRGFLN